MRDRRNLPILIAALVALISGSVAYYQSRHAIKFTTAAVGHLPVRYGCQPSGKVTTPAITIAKLSPGGQGWAFLLEDLNLPENKNVQWLVFNLPPTTAVIPENAGTPGTIAKNLQGVYGYAPPCPPKGQTHRYQLHLYSLKINPLPNLTVDSSKAAFLAAIKPFLLTESTTSFTYRR